MKSALNFYERLVQFLEDELLDLEEAQSLAEEAWENPAITLPVASSQDLERWHEIYQGDDEEGSLITTFWGDGDNERLQNLYTDTVETIVRHCAADLSDDKSLDAIEMIALWRNA